MPPYSASVAPEVRAHIAAELARVEAEHDVKILFAIESGSRAWGFPSPDSDYDVRFVYAHRPDWYLSINPGRDVIELPIDELWDINGWDIRKALGLLIKSNPVLLEWLASPVRYIWDDQICAQLNALAGQSNYATACLFHYLKLAQQQWARHIGESDSVNAKKYFYTLRPALAIYWLRARQQTRPPMNLQELVNGLSLPAALVAQISALIAQKSQAVEAAYSPRLPDIDQFIATQLGWAAAQKPRKPSPDLEQQANRLLRETVAKARPSL
ncbi:MAG: nucleotidyltransferase domain-containing protein [Rhodobacteraceae bacterium]|nr:nucleotidyltransferase domain-containing protein [Paracoccaceae bacterium]